MAAWAGPRHLPVSITHSPPSCTHARTQKPLHTARSVPSRRSAAANHAHATAIMLQQVRRRAHAGYGWTAHATTQHSIAPLCARGHSCFCKQPTLQVGQLLGQQETGHRWLQELGHTLGGSVGAVGSAKGVVHIDVGVGGELDMGHSTYTGPSAEVGLACSYSHG